MFSFQRPEISKDPEAATRGILCEKVLLEISQNLQKKPVSDLTFNKVAAGLRPATLLKKRFWHRGDLQLY